jgi:ubiquinone biosynthesis protein UbiJ
MADKTVKFWLGGIKHEKDDQAAADAFIKQFIDEGKDVYAHYLGEAEKAKRMASLDQQEKMKELERQNGDLTARLEKLEKELFSKSK